MISKLREGDTLLFLINSVYVRFVHYMKLKTSIIMFLYTQYIRLEYLPDKYKHCRPNLDKFYEIMKSRNDYIIFQIMKFLFLAFIRRNKLMVN